MNKASAKIPERVLVITLITCAALTANMHESYLSARSTALGGAYVAISGDVYSMEYNPASIAFYEKGVMVTGSYNAPFSDFDITSMYGGVLVGFPFSSFGFNYKGFGSPYYREDMFALFHGIRILDRFALGWGANAFSKTIDQDNSGLSFNFDIGAYLKINDRIAFGAAGKNLFYSYGTNNATGFPVILRAGVATSLVDDLLVSFAFTHSIEEGFSFHMGAEYALYDMFFFRAGLSTDPGYGAVGVGVNFNMFTVDYAFAYHPDLGATHIASVRFRLDFSVFERGDILVATTNDAQSSIVVDINRDGQKKLMRVFMDETIVMNIIVYREEHTFFRTHEVTKVPGITEGMYMAIEENLTVRERDFEKHVYWLNHVQAEGLAKAGLNEDDIITFLYERDQLGHFDALSALDATTLSEKARASIKAYCREAFNVTEEQAPEKKPEPIRETEGE